MQFPHPYQKLKLAAIPARGSSRRPRGFIFDAELPKGDTIK